MQRHQRRSTRRRIGFAIVALATACGGRDDVSIDATDVVVSIDAPAAGKFASAVPYPTGSRPYSVAIADLNGDGKPDLAVANSGDDTISVLLNTGNAEFAAPAFYLTSGSPTSVAIGDLNSDGRADLVVANSAYATIGVFLNMGNGTFPAQQASYATGSRPMSVAIGDLDADGKPDVAVANRNDNTVSVFLNLGNGTVAAQVPYATGTQPASVAIGDLNGDGKPDLAVANSGTTLTGDTVGVLLNGGNGTFSSQTPYMTGRAPIAVAIDDLNGDGSPDLAVANVTSSASVLLNNNDGTFGPQSAYPVGSGPNSVAIGDLNRDSKPDVVTASFGVMGTGATVSLLLNDGNGAFPTKLTYPCGMGPESVVIGDLNSDGNADLVTANYTDNTVSVLLWEP